MTVPPCVFVVDDDPGVRRALELIIETAGHEVLSFESAAAFLNQWDASRPGCLITDVRMPGMGGLALLRHLTERNNILPVIVLSGHGDIPMAVDAMKGGAVDFLEKPVEANVLRTKVAAALAEDLRRRQVQEECEEIEQLLASLTRREREVMDLLVQGKPARIAATILGTSHNTVRVQRTTVMKKMQADTIADLVRMMSTIGRLDIQ